MNRVLLIIVVLSCYNGTFAISKYQVGAGIAIGIAGYGFYNKVKKNIKKDAKAIKKIYNKVKLPVIGIGAFVLGWNAKAGNLVAMATYLGRSTSWIIRYLLNHIKEITIAGSTAYTIRAIT